MNKVLIFSGTTEGRTLSEILSSQDIHCDVCVATEYGEEVMDKASDMVRVFCGRIGIPEMKELYNNNDYFAVVDATHPYATEVTRNILDSLKGYSIPYLRLKREEIGAAVKKVSYYESTAECVKALKNTTGNVLLTTGSKELSVFCRTKSLTSRLFARVLPSEESIKTCNRNGISGKQIIAMQGPFSEDMNLAQIKQYDIKHLVTKESGKTGGEEEKLAAAEKTGIRCHIIRRPQEEDNLDGYTLGETLRELSVLSGKRITGMKLSVTLAGVGCGSTLLMTEEVRNAIESCGYIFGAERMLNLVETDGEKYPYYRKDDIIPVLEKINNEKLYDKKAIVLFSGDSGFYSGSSNLFNALSELDYVDVNVMPGISSVSLLSAKCGISYSDAAMVSTHGIKEEKWLPQIVHNARYNKRTFFITSGPDDINKLGRALVNANIQPEDVKVILGYQLSYPDEEIISLSPRACLNIEKNGLYAGVIINPAPTRCTITPSMSDDDFKRAEVPMTKEEVRELSICKLHLNRDSVLYDIGAGTGSVSIEAARLSPDISVYAVEYREEAAKLIEKNVTNQALFNIDLIREKAPDGLEKLPHATHAFIGGSGGNMKAILDKLYKINPYMRVVINAVSLDTISLVSNLLKELPVDNVDISQLQVSKVKNVGDYGMLNAQNPVFIFAFDFVDKKLLREEKKETTKSTADKRVKTTETKRIL